MVEGEAEENRLMKKNEVESIAHGDFRNVSLIDPITQNEIRNL